VNTLQKTSKNRIFRIKMDQSTGRGISNSKKAWVTVDLAQQRLPSHSFSESIPKQNDPNPIIRGTESLGQSAKAQKSLPRVEGRLTQQKLLICYQPLIEPWVSSSVMSPGSTKGQAA